jgi:hypothetical protein
LYQRLVEPREALLQTSQTQAIGSRDLVREMVASSQAAYAEALLGTRCALAAVKTVRERTDPRFGLARASANRAVSLGGRSTTASLDLAEKASSPLTVQATRAA